jgi:Cu/Ag efflux protein CusF
MQNKQLSSLALAACLSLGAVEFAALVGAETIEPVGSRAMTTELTGTVAAINTETRLMTVKTPDGTFEVLEIPPEVTRIDGIKIGDKVSIAQTHFMMVDIEKGRDAGAIGSFEKTTTEPEPGEKPAGTLVTRRKVLGKVEAVDRAASLVTIRGPKESVTLAVKDASILDDLKPGDGVIATYIKTISGKVSFR